MNRSILFPCLCAAWFALSTGLSAQSPVPELAGEWEMFLGNKASGVILEMEQQGPNVRATFKVISPKNRYGIRPGFDFFRFRMAENGASGEIVIRKGNVQQGEVVKKEMAPLAVAFNEDFTRMQCRIGGDNVRESEREFTLVRPALVKNIRLYVHTPDGLQPVGKIVEGVPMVVDLELAQPSRRSVEVVLNNGTHELKLTATPVPRPAETGTAVNAGDEGEAPAGSPAGQAWFSRTEPFLATYGAQLGVEPAPEEAERETEGREPTRDDWQQLAGMWKSVYRDAVLGQVTGFVHVSKYGEVKARYRHPESSVWAELKLESARVTGAVEATGEGTAAEVLKWRLEFGERGVVSEKVEPMELGDMPRLLLAADGEPPVRITADTLRAEVPIKRRSSPDFRKVILEFDRKENESLLVWNWKYKADRGTARDAEGFGRVGVLVPMEDDPEASVAWQKGREAWLKDAPAILDTLCLDKQLAFEKDREFDGRLVPEYRYAPRSRTVKMADGENFEDTLARSGNLTRKLFIVTRGLPPEDAGPLTITIGEGSGVEEYRIRARGKEGDPRNSEELRKAWSEYRARERASPAPDAVDPPEETVTTHTIIRAGGEAANVMAGSEAAIAPTPEPEGEIEGLHVLAIIKSGAPPGLQPFRINATRGQWNLLYGDTVARLQFVRKLADEDEIDGTAREWEAITSAFVPERLRIAVKSETAIPTQETIKVALAIGDEVVTHQREQTITLRPDPREPARYISPIIELVREADVERVRQQQPDVIVIGAKNRDKLKAMVAPDSGYLVMPTVAQVPVLNTPEHINALWKSAVKRAADLAGKPVHDWNQVASGEAGSVTNSIITNYVMNSPFTGIGAFRTAMEDLTRSAESAGISVPLASWWKRQAGDRNSIREIQISIGDHAAMLLLRDVFIEMMNEQYRDWARNQTYEKIRNIYGAQREAVGVKQSPLSFYKFKLRELPQFPNADEDFEVYLYQIFDEEYLRDELEVPALPHEIERLKWSAFNHAYRGWGAAMQESISEARTTQDANIEKLLELTGYGFESVVQRLLPRLMKLDTDVAAQRNHWVPDKVARAYVKGLNVLGSAVKAQAKYSEIDTTFALTAASLVTIPLGNIGGFWSAMAALSLSVADAAHAIYTDVIGNWEKEERLAAEVGMGAVLGYGRAAETEAGIVAGWQQALSVGGSLLGVGGDAFAAVKAVKALRMSKVLAEGTDLLKAVDFANPQALRNLGKQDLAVLERFLKHADEMAAAGKLDELTDAQRAALQNQAALRNVFEESGIAAASAGRAAGISEVARPVKASKLEEVAETVGKQIARTERRVEAAKDALKRAEDAKAAARTDADKLKAANKADEAEEAVTRAKDSLGDYNQRKQVLDAMLDQSRGKKAVVEEVVEGGRKVTRTVEEAVPPRPVHLSRNDLSLLEGRGTGLSRADKRIVEDLLRQNGGDWGKLKKLADGAPVDQMDMHRVAMYRRQLMNRLADEAMAEAKALLEAGGGSGPKLKRKAFGSTNLSSDYDVAIEGLGAEVAVGLFNQKVRRAFGGLESGTVVDTNLYTDPVYNLYKAADLAGTEGKLARTQLDAARQFMFQQMANAKYRTPQQWKAFREGVLQGVPPGARKAMTDLMDQAEGASHAAEGMIANRVAQLGEGVSDVGGNKALKATNELYGETLVDIHHYRRMIDSMDEVAGGGRKAVDIPLPPELRGPKMRKVLEGIDGMLASGDPLKRAAGKRALKQLQSRAAVNARSKQGLALYFASEAYQTRGTIAHVVGELQAKGIKLKPDDLINGVRRETNLKPDDYVNSYYENAANLVKELGGKHVLDEAGNLIAGHEKMDAAAMKVAKYFERQLDAANQAGVKLGKLGVNDMDKVVEGTVALNAVRSDAAKFAKKLNELGWTSEDYVRNAMKAMDSLDTNVIKQSSVTGFAGDLHSAERATEAASMADAVTPAWGKGRFARPRNLPPTEEEAQARRAYEQGEGAELAALQRIQASGRHLTAVREERHAELQRHAAAQFQMEQMSTAARMAGVPGDEVDRLLRGARAGAAADWRETAAGQLEGAMQRKLQTTARTRWSDDQPARTSPQLMRALGVPGGGIAPATPGTMRAALQQGGSFVQVPEKAPTIDMLGSQAAGGRHPLVMLQGATGETPVWAEVRGVTEDGAGRKWVHVADGESGVELSYPAELFESLTRKQTHTLIMDPFRKTDGTWRSSQPADLTPVEALIAQALPMAGE